MASSKDLALSGDGNTVIGPSILINGKLSGDDDLIVRGRVEGELTLTRTLIVEPSGIVKANVDVKNAIVSGVVVGNIAASESVELTREGRMVGDIHAPRVIIVDGASFRGRIDMGEGGPAPRAMTERTGRPGLVRAGGRATSALPPRPPPAPARASASERTRPSLPPPPSVSRGAKSTPPAPPAPPSVPAVAEAGKKKVVVKRKK